jgi:DNA repair exonuclease SbcCD ATPase subunit
MLGPTASSGTAQGRVQVALDGVILTVASGEADVDALFTAIEADKKGLAGYLAACGSTTPDDARSKAEAHRRLAADVENAGKVYEGLLQQKSYEQWQAAMQGLEKLPETRDAKTIEKELEAKRAAVTEGDTKSQGFAKSIDEWVRKHTDLPTLGAKFTRGTGELERARADLKKAPSLPEGYASVDEFLCALNGADAGRIAIRDELKERAAALTGLTMELGDRRSQDLVEEAETKERAFIRARAKGRAYLRIRDELERITAAGGTDPMVAFSETVAAMFSRITGRDSTLSFDGTLPASVQRAGVSLPHDRLGQGTTEALALALRLAMAEAYVETGAGFIMLDDPLVNLDRHRMAQAAEIIRKCSEQTQVIFFTCHDQHAAQLGGPAISEPIRLRRWVAKCGVEAPMSWRTSSTVGSRPMRPGCSYSLTGRWLGPGSAR